MITHLDTPIPEPQWPDGITVRTLRYPEDLEAVYWAQDEAFENIGDTVERPFEEAFERWKSYSFDAQGLKPDLWFLALEGEEIAGLINSQERSD